jgi:hypothetical protein
VTSAASQAPAWVDGGAGSMFIITFSFLWLHGAPSLPVSGRGIGLMLYLGSDKDRAASLWLQQGQSGCLLPSPLPLKLVLLLPPLKAVWCLWYSVRKKLTSLWMKRTFRWCVCFCFSGEDWCRRNLICLHKVRVYHFEKETNNCWNNILAQLCHFSKCSFMSQTSKTTKS